ncbi:MAG: PIG-L family deacetylase [SAR202 cluster bacterium]|nr:PIG-L family deacetylase [SAR202 cluster bacterium]
MMQETRVEETPKRVLVVTPHPDDAEISCGGTVAKWVKAGAEAYYVLCTDGGKGSEDPKMTHKRLAKIRLKEQMDAAAVLGVKDVVPLGHPDGELEETREFRGQIVLAIRRFKPDVVICPDPYRRTFYFHRDHRITGIVTQDAVFPYARDRLHYAEHEKEGLEPHKTPTILFWGAEECDTYIDITDTLELKVEALKKHDSQVGGLSSDDTEKWLRDWAKDMGKKAGYEYAEAYRKVSFRF